MFTLPFPNQPASNTAPASQPVRDNFTAISQAIQSFDGSQIQAATIGEAALANAINPRLRGSETISNFVASGAVWSLVSGLNGTMSAGVIYVNGYRTPVNSIGSRTFTASKDTYVDLDYLGNVAYVEVANGATAGMTLTTNSTRVAKVITNGSAITSVVLTGIDPLGNLIYPQSSESKQSVTRQDDTTNSTKKSSAILTGWGYIANNTGANNISEVVTFGGTFLDRPIVTAVFGGDHASATTYGSGGNNVAGRVVSKAHTVTTTGFTVQLHTGDGTNFGAGNSFYQWMAIGEVV